MRAHLTLATVSLKHEAPLIDGQKLEGVQEVRLRQKLGHVAEAVITILPTDVEFSGQVEVYFRTLGLAELINEALLTDGDHHKQWFLERIAEALHIDQFEHEAGIAP